MVGSARSLLTAASKEVTTADHLLSDIYPLSRDPRILLSVVRHAHAAVTLAGRTGVYAQPAPVAAVEARFVRLLDAHAGASTAFSRDARLVLADDGFSSLVAVAPGEVEEGLRAVKTYVHEVGRRVVMAHDGKAE